MPQPTGYPTLAVRAISQEDIIKLREICDYQKFSYGVFCAIIVSDVLADRQLTEK